MGVGVAISLERESLEEGLRAINAPPEPRERLSLLDFPHPSFTLKVPEPTTLPEDRCVDERFTGVQFHLHLRQKVATGIQGAVWREEARAHHVLDEVVACD